MPHKVLPEHKRTKGKLVAPMNHVLQDNGYHVEQRWVSHEEVVVPEILWLAYLDNDLGHARAAEVVTKLLEAVSKIAPTTQVNGFASSFARLDDGSTAKLAEVLSAMRMLDDMRSSLADLGHLFPMFPLNRLLGKGVASNVHVSKLKEIITLLNDRVGVATTYALALLFYGTRMTGRITINPGLTLSKPELIEDYPNTPESQMLAANLRASSKMLDPEVTTSIHSSGKRTFGRHA